MVNLIGLHCIQHISLYMHTFTVYTVHTLDVYRLYMSYPILHHLYFISVHGTSSSVKAWSHHKEFQHAVVKYLV